MKFQSLVLKIPLLTRPKKNSQEIKRNRRTGRLFIGQSYRYDAYNYECKFYLNQWMRENQTNSLGFVPLPIDCPVNLKLTFYVPDRRRRDIANLVNAIQDVLVEVGILEDDNFMIVKSLDGTRIIYEKGREETIVEITRLEDE